MSILIAPSILSADLGCLTDEIQKVDRAGADWIHVDVMDGHFVPNLTFGPVAVRTARKATAKPIDVHLMIERPEQSLAAYVDAGADIVTVHAEACTHLHRTVEQIRKLGVKAGVSLNPHTNESVLHWLIDQGAVDLILLMTVNPGFGGQSFIAGSDRKIEAVASLCARAHHSPAAGVVLQVDGGVTVDTMKHVRKAHSFVAGSAVFGPGGQSQDTYQSRIAALRSAAE